jgi:hypothetical protein
MRHINIGQVVRLLRQLFRHGVRRCCLLGAALACLAGAETERLLFC